ncbi:MAG: cysteine--tRNA ligase [Promethearchaeota archaeon]
MIKFIKGLISKGHAYEINGSVYFSVNSFPNYETIFQNLKNKDNGDEDGVLQENQDTSYNDEKRDPRDFALWKKSKEGEPFWESPWGKGRPGWHIECSSMVIDYLGETIDIHGGGQDLKFPHHRNEIAQSEAYTGKTFANYFMHNGFVNVNDEKMSKSLGNFFLVSDVAKEFDPMVIRFFLISSHYRKSINYSFNTITQAKKNYNKLLNTISKVNEIKPIESNSEQCIELISKIDSTEKKVINAMDDDFNTPVAIAEIMKLFRDINRKVLENKIVINRNFKIKFFDFIYKIDNIFGIFPNLKEKIEEDFAQISGDKDKLINNLLGILKDTREMLRAKKIYEISDFIREKLREMGINIEDK